VRLVADSIGSMLLVWRVVGVSHTAWPSQHCNRNCRKDQRRCESPRLSLLPVKMSIGDP